MGGFWGNKICIKNTINTDLKLVIVGLNYLLFFCLYVC